MNPVEKNFKIIKESMLFDEKWYVSQYLKSNENINPIRHYITEGVKRNLNPSSFFNTKWYLENNDDVKKSGMNPFVHYILHGRKEGRLPNSSFNLENEDDYSVILYSGLFDIQWFNEFYSLKDTGVNVIKYYVDYYLCFGLNPSPNFDSLWYLENNDDVKKSGMNPFVHYILHGRKEGRLPIL